MISFLLDSIVNLALWLVYGVETAIDAVLSAFGAVALAAIALLPSFPSAPSLPVGSWLGWVNWFIPVGTMLTTAAGLLTLYVTVLAVRWVLHWAGLID